MQKEYGNLLTFTTRCATADKARGADTGMRALDGQPHFGVTEIVAGEIICDLKPSDLETPAPRIAAANREYT